MESRPTEGYPNSVYGVSVRGGEATSFNGQVPLVGPASGVSRTTYFQDAAARPGGDDITTFGSATEGDDSSLKPRVHRAVPNTRETRRGELEVEEFDLGKLADGDEMGECHHPAWRPDGARVLCTSLGDFESFGAGGSVRARAIYEFSQDTLGPPGTGGWGTWSQVGKAAGSGLLFQPPSAAELGAPFDTKATSHGQLRFTYKFAQWCGSKNYVTLTLSATQAGENEAPILASRIYLVRLDPLATWDVTSWLEDHLGADRGALAGIFSTCAVAEGEQ